MNFVDSPAIRMLDLIKGVFERNRYRVITKHNLSLETLVNFATFTETSNERDTIYALVNMANNTTSTLQSYNGFALLPDYGKRVLTVYADFIRHC
jgi:hypothetical protein